MTKVKGSWNNYWIKTIKENRTVSSKVVSMTWICRWDQCCGNVHHTEFIKTTTVEVNKGPNHYLYGILQVMTNEMVHHLCIPLKTHSQVINCCTVVPTWHSLPCLCCASSAQCTLCSQSGCLSLLLSFDHHNQHLTTNHFSPCQVKSATKQSCL